MTSAHQHLTLFGDLSGRGVRPSGGLAPRTPLVVAIHGGTYTSAYFDIPGCSLFERAAANGIPLLAPDRPGYAGSPSLPAAEMDIGGQARHLAGALEDAWRRHGAGTAGIVLIGHSIGAAIACEIAAAAEGLPLLGLAISGVGLRTPPEFGPMWAQLPDTPTVEMPAAVKDMVMFGPEGSFDPAVVRASDAADAAAPKVELLDIVGGWEHRVHDVLGRIRVPVHYRQAEVDRLWVVDTGEVAGFALALAGAPRVDAEMMRGTGHCIDFHHVGRALQLQQLGFALQCAAEPPGCGLRP
ncbi:alpha/beta fold hydrolase [Pelomonas sp. KK5]|uniref:alpha/beta fold hydrolase n=1 Tax=Pelomonas sp. KK5 TaxID=1855730 RepID=UPI00097C8A78|nr:alpha/beta fold hydrolase [Pelomonas sp. KK5]